ncbi:hypothetical protein [Acinetobacter sp. YH12218]|uniref:hypothetical protein n=1 Tax=Acinetobacter sp. YH12218 TaxID=2601152 RepID=UPI0015D28941|nr:hypothetical protein [Acinetobacter sp. YH12218]
MQNSSEKKAFGTHLKQQPNAHQLPDSPTVLAKEFNLRYSGNPISVQAANNWLMSIAIPTQDKLQILAAWLNVSTQWLRFGEQPTESQSETLFSIPSEGISKKFEKLSPKQQLLVQELIEALLRLCCIKIL